MVVCWARCSTRFSFELGLHLIPEILVDDRLVLAGVGLVLVDDLAAVEPVLQQIGRDGRGRSDGRRGCCPLARDVSLGGDALGVELLLQRPDGAERQA